MAAETDNWAEVERALFAGAKPSRPVASGGRTALHVACAAGSKGATALLCQYDADVDLQDAAGRTALHMAAAHGHISCVRCLVESAAAVNCRDKRGDTPLHYAAEAAHTHVAELLGAYGAELSAKNNRNLTPLEVAKATHSSHGGRGVSPTPRLAALSAAGLGDLLAVLNGAAKRPAQLWAAEPPSAIPSAPPSTPPTNGPRGAAAQGRLAFTSTSRKHARAESPPELTVSSSDGDFEVRCARRWRRWWRDAAGGSWWRELA